MGIRDGVEMRFRTTLSFTAWDGVSEEAVSALCGAATSALGDMCSSLAHEEDVESKPRRLHVHLGIEASTRPSANEALSDAQSRMRAAGEAHGLDWTSTDALVCTGDDALDTTF